MAAKKLFDHLNAITAEQDPNYFDKLSEEDMKSWSNFMINRFLSMKPEWVEMIATLLPLTQTLQPKEMYKLYINILPKGKQYLKYTKGKAEDKYEQFFRAVDYFYNNGLITGTTKVNISIFTNASLFKFSNNLLI